MGKEVFCLQGQLDFFTEERQFPPDDLPLLTARVRLPRWDGQDGRRFDLYYTAYARAFFSYCLHTLLPRATEALALSRQSGGAIPDWHITLDTNVTLHTDRLVSLYTDTVEQTDGRRLVVRRADTWDLAENTPLPPTQLFPGVSVPRRRLLGDVTDQILRRQEQGLAAYNLDWRRAIRAAFSADHLYLTPEHLCLFYQMYTIAPALEGIPVFRIPYDEKRGPRLPA